MSYFKSLTLLSIFCLISAFNCFPLEWKNNSVLSSGKWAKVEVTENGIQEISYDKLRQLGFEHPEKVTLFGYGGTLLSQEIFLKDDPDDLPQLPLIHNNQRILFYGRSHQYPQFDKQSKVDLLRNHYALAGYYYLTDSFSPVGIENLPYETEIDCDTLDTHTAINFINRLDYNPVKAGLLFYSNNISTDPEAGKMTIPTPGRVPETSATVNGTILSDGYRTFTLNMNGTVAKTQSQIANGYLSTNLSSYSVPYSADKNDNIEIVISPSGGSSFIGYDYMGVTYTRSNRITDLSELPIILNRTANQTRLLFPGIAADKLTVWDITNQISLKSFDVTDATSESEQSPASIIFIDGRCSPSVATTHRHLIAFRPDATHHVPSVEPFSGNQNLHALETPHMLIITTDECHAQAERLADLHRSLQGLDVLVVRHQDIFNEFSSGTQTPMAYRRFAKMLYDRDNKKFRYLLLFGGSIYDNRRLLPENKMYTPDKVLVCYQTDNPKFQFEDGTSFTTDSYYGLLHNNATGQLINNYEESGYQKMLVSVGRIPAINESDARNYVDKAEAYLTNGISAEAQTRALIFGDDGDKDIHLISAETMASYVSSTIPYTVITRAHNGIYPWVKGVGEEARRQITGTLEKGVGLFIYSGHGRPDCFTSEGLWNRRLVYETPITQFPFIYFASCNAFSFDRQENSISEASLFAPDGGTIALISATREVLNDENREFGLIILSHLAKADENDTFGDIFRNARNENYYLRGYTAARANTNAYIFGGDPALPAHRPALSIDLLEVNGKPAADDTSVLIPLKSNRIKAEITDRKGNLASGYNGTATISIYESQRRVPNLYSDKAPAAQQILKEVRIDDDLLYTVTIPVRNGLIDGEIIIPSPARPDEKARMIFSAESSDQPSLNAIGYTNDIIVSADTDKPATDHPRPVISQMYLNSPEFTDGGMVSQSPTLHLVIEDASSVQMPGASTIGQSLKLTVDDLNHINKMNVMRSDDGNSLTITAPLTGLSEGHHFLTISVNDLFSNVISETLNFQIVSPEAEISLIADKTIVDTEVTFDADHSLADNCSAKLIIENINGLHILTVSNATFPFTWNTADKDGKPVPDGTYIIRTMADDGIRFCGSQPLKITVIR